MKDLLCVQEEQIVSAVTTKQWAGELLDHLSTCSLCQEIVQVSEWLDSPLQPPPDHAVPNFSYVWWEAKMLKQQTEQERALRLVLLTQIGSYAIILLSFGGLLIWYMAEIREWLARQVSLLQQNGLPLGANVFTIHASYILAGIFFLSALLWLHRLLVED